jgi:hypothetical protein
MNVLRRLWFPKKTVIKRNFCLHFTQLWDTHPKGKNITDLKNLRYV